MKVLKSVFVILAVLGFILVYGTVGTSDLETETGVVLITSTEFYIHLMLSASTFVGGIIGVTTCNIINHIDYKPQINRRPSKKLTFNK